ncbi:hypothetical protein CPB83DRAFT_629750 [Crepidotus variabilis]|uniref:Uncharacterized protein n=1 Tax=Crepidotus variabilis TaxID=179855 RepID=A0A9P6JTP0_9AGAR|nr:hypothetical protein CPB83DRAFT_629750 [Crepidotus variabilis]
MLSLAVRRCQVPKLLQRRTQIRTLATERPYQNLQKLKALPFHCNPEDAQKRMSKFLLPLISDDSALYSIFSSFVLDKMVRPVQFSAAYFPVWVLNAEIEVDLTHEGVRRRGSILFQNSCIPGSHLAPLCSSPFWSPSIEELVCVAPEENLMPFDESLLHQQGEDVHCIPYSTSPFALLDKVKNLTWEDNTVDKHLTFSPSSLEVKILSASPILLPIYLAKYETEPEENVKQTLTAWMSAHKFATPNVMTENLNGKIHEERLEALVFTMSKIHNSFNGDGEVYTFDSYDQTTVSPIGFPGQKRLPNAIKNWLHDLLSRTSNIATLASPLKDDGDPRIRAADIEESVQLDMYFKNEIDIALAKRILDDITNPKTGTNLKVIHIGLDGREEFGGEGFSPEQPLQKRLEILEKRRENLTPSWWSDWQKSQSNPVPNSESAEGAKAGP